ncbi:Regulator of chromosome condensation 1/beta-lactamase-inhibitor protein II [Arabidopsis suecica]|uniref:Regulator of chromosome condensation 1/beta-lactamase-inhibitor protein II n=1 Tax=Arabidopsis suecica TaxID=45249 RepID=A0A8T2B303_ARASU|nr:Regulator of chromosome condensation 1/beta-lactamase-inhibitor protein II [Arabidopsis suecica]
MKLDEISSVTRELILRTGLRMLERTEPEKTRECRFRRRRTRGKDQLGYTSVDTQAPPRKVTSLKAKIVAVSAANKHTAVVSECGEVFTWGCNKEGQLGYGTSNSASNYSPRLVDYLKGKVLTAITSSKYHTLMLRDDGEDGKTMLDMTMISGFPKESDFVLLSQKKDNPPDSPRSKKIATAANKKKNRKGGLSMFLAGALDDIPMHVVAPPLKPKIEGPVWGGAEISKGLSSLRDIHDEQSKGRSHEPVRTTKNQSGDDSSGKTEGKILLSSFLTSKPIPIEPAKSLLKSDVEKGTPPWASSETPRNLSRPSLRDIQMQEVKKQQSLSHSPKTKTSDRRKSHEGSAALLQQREGSQKPALMMDLLELRTKNLTVKMKLFDAHCHLQDKRVIDEASQLISAAFSCRCYQFRSQWNLRERLGLGERDGRDVSFCCSLLWTTSLVWPYEVAEKAIWWVNNPQKTETRAQLASGESGREIARLVREGCDMEPSDWLKI